MTKNRIDVEPWERQRGESQKSFAAFVLYRDAGSERTLVKVGQEAGKNRRLIERWSVRWCWVVRVAAWDQEVDKLYRAKNLKAIFAARDRWAMQSRAKAQTLLLADAAISSKVNDAAAMQALNDLSIVELIKLSAAGAIPLTALHRSEALALGDVTDRPAAPVVERIRDSFLERAIAEATPEDRDRLMSQLAEAISLASSMLTPAEPPPVLVDEPKEVQ